MHYIVFIFITLIKIQCNTGVNKVSCEFNMFINAVGFLFLSNYDPRTKVFTIKEGNVGFFGFADLANFLFGFLVFALKKCVFSVLVSCAVRGFPPS